MRYHLRLKYSLYISKSASDNRLTSAPQTAGEGINGKLKGIEKLVLHAVVVVFHSFTPIGK